MGRCVGGLRDGLGSEAHTWAPKSLLGLTHPETGSDEMKPPHEPRGHHVPSPTSCLDWHWENREGEVEGRAGGQW